MYYYALYRPYGRDTLSTADTLHRFESEDVRDAKVMLEPWNGRHYHWISITRAEARHWFPRAFANLDWPSSDERWEDNIWLDRPTGGEYEYLDR